MVGVGGPHADAVPAPQVCLFFQNQLFRGTRVTKVDTRRFAAFCSPNLPPLAVVGADVISKLRGPAHMGAPAGPAGPRWPVHWTAWPSGLPWAGRGRWLLGGGRLDCGVGGPRR